MEQKPSTALWLSTPNHHFVEIAVSFGFTNFILDVEHGLFDLAATDSLVALCKQANANVYAKIRGGGPDAVQQMLDRGCNGIIIPHIDGIDHATLLSGAAKYPPLGCRSFDGGRTVGFGAAAPSYFESSNTDVLAIPMIETAHSLAVVEEIAKLPTVDALFVGPYDLSLSCGRGAYQHSADDVAALHRISAAAAAAGKPWWMPAWSSDERATAASLGASLLVVAEEFGFFHDGIKRLDAELKANRGG